MIVCMPAWAWGASSQPLDCSRGRHNVWARCVIRLAPTPLCRQIAELEGVVAQLDVLSRRIQQKLGELT